MRENIEKRDIPNFPVHYYVQIFAKRGTHGKLTLFFASKRGTVPPRGTVGKYAIVLIKMLKLQLSLHNLHILRAPKTQALE